MVIPIKLFSSIAILNCTFLPGGPYLLIRCILPVSNNEDLPANYGLRHRSALGLTETTDSIVLIVSEETGQLSLAHEGIIEQNLKPAEIRIKLNDYLLEDKGKSKFH